jgi:hypothetical protein
MGRLLSILFIPILISVHSAEKMAGTPATTVAPGEKPAYARTRLTFPALDGSYEYRTYSPCSFTVKLPSNYSVRPMYSDRSNDYCDYVARTPAGYQIIELHSMLSSRFTTESISKLYYKALANDDYDITYKTQKQNWFVVSGYRVETGNVIYWKRVVGRLYISDLFIEYPERMASQIEPHIGVISNSFTSD